MSREIKFRAWCYDQQRMFNVYGMGLDFVTEDTLDGVDPGVNCFSGEDFKKLIPMQFIGLKDKNGKEIYEGDIIPMKVGLKSYANWTVGDPNSTLNGFVEWNRFQLCWQIGFKQPNKLDLVSSSFGWGGSPAIEVIGNIYQNPELLKGDNNG